MESNRDDFYASLMGEIELVNKMQVAYVKQNQHNSQAMHYSLADFITQKLIGEKLSDSKQQEVFAELRKMRKDINLTETSYYSVVFRAFCQDAKMTAAGKE